MPSKGQKRTLAEKWRLTSLSNRAITIATIVIAAANVIYVIVSYRTLGEIKSGSIDTHKLAESTLAASRAWLVVQGTGFGLTKDKSFPSGRVVLADSGESPAFGVEGWRCVEVRSEEPPVANGQLQKSPTATCLPVAGGVLGKGVPITMNAYVDATVPPDFSKETDGAGPHFYYWGIVTYDIYPKDFRHSMSFCLKNAAEQLSACREGGYEAN